MIGLPFKKTILAALLVLIGGTGAYLVIAGRDEPPPPLDPLPELVYGRIVEAIAAAVEIPKGTERILVAPIPGDGQEKLRSRIQNRLGDRTYVEVITEEEGTVQPTTGETLAQLYERGRAWLLSVPVAAEDKKGIDVLLVTRVDEHVDDDERLRLRVSWQQGVRNSNNELTVGKSGEAGDEVAKSLFDGDYLGIWIADFSVWGRLGLWLALLVGVPLAGLGVIREVLKKESNLANALLIGTVGLPGILTGWLLTAFGQGWTGGGLVLLAVAASLTYSYFFLTLVEESRP